MNKEIEKLKKYCAYDTSKEFRELIDDLEKALKLKEEEDDKKWFKECVRTNTINFGDGVECGRKEVLKKIDAKLKDKVRFYIKERIEIKKCKLKKLYTQKDKNSDDLKIINRIIALNDLREELKEIKQ